MIPAKKTFGKLFFCKVDELGDLPKSEIAEIKLFVEMPENSTYPEIHPHLIVKTQTNN